MKTDAHHQAALDIEQTIADLGDPAAKLYICRTIIEGYWGASFQWLAYGSDRKHGRHKEKHQGLAKFLRDLGEPAIAQAIGGTGDCACRGLVWGESNIGECRQGSPILAGDSDMGAELNQQLADEVVQRAPDDACDTVSRCILQIPWLDAETGNIVGVIIETLAAEHPEFRAAILYGSVARHEERSLDDQAPSDVDVLVLFVPLGGKRDFPFEQHRAIFASVGRARARLPEPPRDIQVLPVAYDLADWDEMFVENIARDGMLLWARGELPPSLAAVGQRRRLNGETGQPGASQRNQGVEALH